MELKAAPAEEQNGAPIESAQARTDERKVVLGKIVGAFGVGGWVKVDSHTDPPGNILKYPIWQIALRAGIRNAGASQEWKTIKPVSGRVTAKGVQAQLDGVTTRDAAEALRGAEIAVFRSELPKLKAGQYYWDDLIGLQAFSPKGEVLGKLVDIRDAPAHALLQIVGERNGKRVEYLVPLVNERLLSVDIAAQRMTVDWQPDW